MFDPTHAQNVIAMCEAINTHPSSLHFALLRLETARDRMNDACSAGEALPDEHVFGALEQDLETARKTLSSMLFAATGLPADRLVEALS